jgi:hypothetical protein
MEYSYSFAQIIHLICAIIFLGYIFVDVVILPKLKTKYSDNQYNQLKSNIGEFASKIMPKALLVIILTGGYMLSRYINSDIGYFSTSLQQLLSLKALLGLSIGGLVLFSITYRKTKGKPHPFLKKYIHKISLFLGAIIVVLAKVMFILS